MKYQVAITDPAAGRLWEETALPAADIDYLHLVNLFPGHTYQEFRGFGGAFTESAGHCFSKLPPEARREFLDAYFSPGGLGYTLGRVHLGSCDFSLGHYEAVSDPADTDFATFQLEQERAYLFPLLRAATETAGRPLPLLASPWSPPAFMKTNGERNNGGGLRPEYRRQWARLLARYVRAFRDEGLAVELLSVQNEPEATQTWDSCRYSAVEERDFVRDHLGPVLEEAGLADVGILVWDHNKDLLAQRAQAILSDPAAARYIAGTAFHWYTGDHFEAVALTRELFPEKLLYFSEGCVEFSRFSESDAVAQAEMYAHDILGNLNAGMNGSLDWNLLLDAQGGPNHVGNYCDAPIRCAPDWSGIEKRLSYYYIGHFSRYIRPGAVRTAHSAYSASLETTVFRNPDGERVAVLLNRTDRALPVTLREGKAAGCTLELPPHSIATVRYAGEIPG